MRRNYLIVFLVFTLFFQCFFICFAQTETGFLIIDNAYKVAAPSETVQFDVTLINNESNRTTFLIHNVLENPVLYLPLDFEADSVYDFSSFGHHGTINGASWVDGKYGKALSFDGVDDYVETGPFSLTGSTLTVTSWIYSNTNNGLGEIIGSGVYDANGYINIYRNGPNLYVGYYADGFQYLAWNNFFSVGEWIHLAVILSYDRLTIEVFKNGVSLGSKSMLPNAAWNHSKFIGAYRNTGSNCFNGILDEVSLYNRALTAEEILGLYNNSWNEELDNYYVNLDSGKSANVTFSVKIPDDARAGYIKDFLLTAFSLSDPENIETKTVEVTNHYDVDLTLDKNEQMGKPGETLGFQANERNLGNIEDTYDISVKGGEGWAFSISTDFITVPFGEMSAFNISITVPNDALPGNYTTFSISVTSRGDPTLVQQVNGTLMAAPAYLLSITADPQLSQVPPGSKISFALEIQNIGTAPDTIILTFQNTTGWLIEIDPAILTLETAEIGKVTVSVKVPEDAFVGQTNSIVVQAASKGDPSITYTTSFSVKVVTPFWEIPAIVFVMGIVFGVFVGATLTGSIILRRLKLFHEKDGENGSNSLFG